MEEELGTNGKICSGKNEETIWAGVQNGPIGSPFFMIAPYSFIFDHQQTA